MALYGGIDMICQLILAYELRVVELGTVRGEEEDTRDQELIISVVIL